MATTQEIVSDPRFAKATGEQRQRLLSRASDASASDANDFQKIFMPGNEAQAHLYREAAGNPLAEAGGVQDPVATAKMIPPAAAVGGALSPVPGGATLGTVLGRQASNAALRAIGKEKEIPSGGEQMLEGALAAAGDVLPIPLAKAKYFGSQIGAAEQAAGVKGIEKVAPPSGMRTAVKYVQGLKAKLADGSITPLEARAIKPALDTIWNKGWLGGSEYISDLADVSSGIAKTVNQIPGRAAPAEAMARSMTIPNMITGAAKAIPKRVRMGFEGAVGAGAGWQALKSALGSRGGR